MNCSPRPLKFLAVADLQHAITQQRGILLDHCSYTLGDDELLPADRRCGFKGAAYFWRARSSDSARIDSRSEVEARPVTV